METDFGSRRVKTATSSMSGEFLMAHSTPLLNYHNRQYQF
jgi:hypothetical protein